tara:strand:+ start:418 stop:651 length:234 start_codon:yes stop_codon:yes gene_type:complete
MGQQWLIKKIQKVLGKDELTSHQIVIRLQNEGKSARNVSKMQIAGIMSKYNIFEKVEKPNKNHSTVWRNKNAMDRKI